MIDEGGGLNDSSMLRRVVFCLLVVVCMIRYAPRMFLPVEEGRMLSFVWPHVCSSFMFLWLSLLLFCFIRCPYCLAGESCWSAFSIS